MSIFDNVFETDTKKKINPVNVSQPRMPVNKQGRRAKNSKKNFLKVLIILRISVTRKMVFP
jgi:hypothetical protein